MGNVKVTLNDRGFLVTKEEIADGLAERVLIERFRQLVAKQADKPN